MPPNALDPRPIVGGCLLSAPFALEFPDKPPPLATGARTRRGSGLLHTTGFLRHRIIHFVIRPPPVHSFLHHTDALYRPTDRPLSRLPTRCPIRCLLACLLLPLPASPTARVAAAVAPGTSTRFVLHFFAFLARGHPFAPVPPGLVSASPSSHTLHLPPPGTTVHRHARTLHTAQNCLPACLLACMRVKPARLPTSLALPIKARRAPAASPFVIDIHDPRLLIF